MVDGSTSPAVIVGVDGSDAGIGAALWAVDEATSRSLPLRLVYVIAANHPCAADYDAEVARAKAALGAARAAVEAAGGPVRVQTAMLSGPAGPTLVAQSEGAALICVGSVGINGYARAIVGSTAAELAERARCPVAIIRPRDGAPDPDVDWIVVAINAEPHQDGVVEQAMREARLRGAPVLALGDRRRPTEKARSALDHAITVWRERYPDVRVYPVDDGADVAHFVRHQDEQILLAVVGESEAGHIAQIVGRPEGHHSHHPLRRGESSVLVVRC